MWIPEPGSTPQLEDLPPVLLEILIRLPLAVELHLCRVNQPSFKCGWSSIFSVGPADGIQRYNIFESLSKIDEWKLKGIGKYIIWENGTSVIKGVTQSSPIVNSSPFSMNNLM